MSEKKPEPLIPSKTRRRCPVCGEVSYTLGGVHPQCSVRREDLKRTYRTKDEIRSAQKKKPSSPDNGVASWQKNCPKCSALQHVRKAVCDCGHKFVARTRPPTGEGDHV